MDRYSVPVLIGIMCVIFFLIGRTSKSVDPVIVTPDVSRYLSTIDSLKSVNKKYDDSISSIYHQIDSLKKKKVINKKKTQDGIIEIKNFTPDSRLRWRDSVRRANGL